MTSHPGGKGAARLVAATAITAVVVGCTSSQPSGEPDGRTTTTPGTPSQLSTVNPSPSPTSPLDQAQQRAVTAYLGMWKDYAAAAETSDWQSPQLTDHATGEALSVMSRGLYASHYNGLVSKGEPVLDPQVSSVDPPNDPTTVVISDCGDSSNWLRYDAETGELAEDEEGGRRSITATVEKQPDGAWKVAGFAVEELGSC